MRLAGGRLQLSPKPEQGLSLPIDIFFGSLAEQAGERALAVVLSGTGSDGSRGIAAVNAAGGFVFVQDPTTAKFDGMPRSAIATGLVDVVAPGGGAGGAPAGAAAGTALGHVAAGRRRRAPTGRRAAAGRHHGAAAGQRLASTSATTSPAPCCGASC